MGTKRNKIEVGTRVAYSANFLRQQGIHSGSAPMRRGTVLSLYSRDHARVKWDDADYVALGKQWGEDYAEDARENGQLVSVGVLAAVGSSAMVAL